MIHLRLDESPVVNPLLSHLGNQVLSRLQQLLCHLLRHVRRELGLSILRMVAKSDQQPKGWLKHVETLSIMGKNMENMEKLTINWCRGSSIHSVSTDVMASK